MFETLTSEVHERRKYTDTSESEKQKGIVDLGGPAGPRNSTVELGPELTVPLCKTSASSHGRRNTDEKGRKAGQARAGQRSAALRLTYNPQSCSLLLNGVFYPPYLLHSAMEGQNERMAANALSNVF